MKTVQIALLVVSLLSGLGVAVECNPPIGTPTTEPIGSPKGIYPGRVVWNHNKEVATWDGVAEFWWQDKYVNQDIVETMLSQTLTKLTNSQSLKQSWDSLFKLFNQEHRYTNRGYLAGEKIAIKINLNTQWPDSNGTYYDTNANSISPQFLKAVIRTLTADAGVNQSDIYIYDGSRIIPPALYNPPEGLKKEFPDIHFVDNQGHYGRELVRPDSKTSFFFSNKEVPNFDQTLLPTCATEADYMIPIDNFRGHDLAGVTLSGKNWFGSIHRPCCPDPYCGSMSPDGVCSCEVARHWCPASLHWFVNVSNVPMGSYSPLVDLLGHDKLGGNAVVFLMDGLYGGPDEQPWTLPVKFTSKPFDNHWSSSVLASQDPIALDSVAFDILRNEPNIPFASSGCVDNYLHEAALAENPPSGVTYSPNGKTTLNSLGVHEHWNNDNDKQYSRNLGMGFGIELVALN